MACACGCVYVCLIVWIFSTEQFQAAYMRRATTVPFYETFDQETIEYIINHTELQTVVCTDELLQRLIDAKPACQHLKFVVRMDSSPNQELKNKCKDVGIDLYTFEEVEQLGQTNPRDALLPEDDDIATFCYTSGTTGVPKAAMISHGNLGAVVNGISHAGIHLHTTDRYLSYLPLAHTLERIVTAYCLAAGACIGFYQGDVKKLVDDLQTLRPTIFVSVPRLFNRMYEGVSTSTTHCLHIAVTIVHISVFADHGEGQQESDCEAACADRDGT